MSAPLADYNHWQGRSTTGFGPHAHQPSSTSSHRPRRLPSPLAADAEVPEWVQQQNKGQGNRTRSSSTSSIGMTTPSKRPSILGSPHSRSASFFSFRSQNKSQHSQEPVSATINPLGRTTSNQSGIDEFGARPSSSQSGRLQQPPGSPGAQPMSRNLQGQPMATGPQQPPPLHPEIRSVVQLTLAHTRKIYFSGPLVRRIERQPDGQRPSKDEGWTDVWAQLGGTTLSIWDMKLTEEASRQGKEVPPSYINITDAVRNTVLGRSSSLTRVTPSSFKFSVRSLSPKRQRLLLNATAMFSLLLPLDQIFCCFHVLPLQTS
jgi:CCR4-NOT transcriptional complex subunit CAF120